MEKVKPKKHLGQHFLIDLSIAERIAEGVTGHAGVTQVLEIGPGMGVLTDFLMKGNLEVHLIEIDRESIAYLHQKYPELKDRILEGDFLKFDLGAAFPAPISIAGNFFGPALIGGVSELTSLPISFGLIALLLLLVGRQSRYISVKEIK